MFWSVWNPNGPDGGTPKYKHATEISARHEAERLARLHPGQSFYVLAPLAVVRRNDVEWKEFSENTAISELF
ncbi:MAG: hypothetical protein K8I29_19725 [Alphaproteobacteria bacterium]|uniref:Uncharacterized protein n=1 Tax=Candidatus Nitrobium versatile TaxID=2884831 RepID=A0A953M3S7_9BACT|nr:hypothetical protein [Candidatus Nitrobium versatile]